MQTENMPSILVVDDDEAASALVARMLQLHNFRSVGLNDSTRVLQAVQDDHPDLVLLDLVMPKLSGTEVLEALRMKFSPMELPVVMLTAMDDSSNIAACLKLGANDYLSKPIDSVVAIARITTQLEMVRLYRENLHKKEVETLNAMIVTYNHEINNPLAAATLSLPSDVKDVSRENLDVVRESLRQIAGIVSRIDHLAYKKNIQKGTYSDHSEFIRL